MIAPDLNNLDLLAIQNSQPALDEIDLPALASQPPSGPPDVNNIDLTAITNPTPPINNIDLLGGSPPPPNDDVEGVLSASLDFTASFAGSQVVGALSSSLGFDASFGGAQGAVGELSASLGFAASLTGYVVSTFGTVSAGLEFGASFTGYQDWLSLVPPAELQEVYRLVITGNQDGETDLFIGRISSWQATNQAGGRSSYLQAVIPAAEQLLPEIEARQNGQLVLQKGYRLSDGSIRYEDIMRSRFDTLRPDRGGRSLTVTVSGYLSGKVASTGTRTLKGIRGISAPNGKRRVRCDVDLFLQPGMTVDALGETFRADYINYYVSQADKFCEVAER